MTILSATNRIQYIMDGATLVFPYAFIISKASDLVVTKITIATGAEEILVLNTDYTVSGVGVQAGGNVTITGSAESSLIALDIERVFPFTQILDLIANGAVPNETFELSIDKIVGLCQQLDDRVGRAATFSVLQTTAVTFPALNTGPGVLTTDGLTLTWNPLVVTDTQYGGTISFGLAANRPANPTAGDVWYELDSETSYVSYTNGSWTRVNLDINNLTLKAAPVDADLLAIEDSADSFNQKKITVSSLEDKIQAVVIAAGASAKDNITRGFELVFNSTTILDVNPGTLYHGNTQINKIASVSLTVGTGADWFDGSQESYAGGANWSYVGVDSGGNVKFLGSNPPDVDDTAGNTGGIPLYFDDTAGVSGEYWRVIGSIFISVADQFSRAFFQRGNLIMLNVPSNLTTATSVGAWSGALATTIPAISTLAIIGASATQAGAATPIWLRPNGSTWAINPANSIQGTSQVGGQRIVATDGSQQIQYRNGAGMTATRVDIEGYILNIL